MSVLQSLTSDEKAVRLYVCPSVKRVNCDKTEELSRCLYHMKNHLAYFSENKNGWWGQPLLPEILGQPAHIAAKSPILIRYYSYNRKSTTRFPMSLR